MNRRRISAFVAAGLLSVAACSSGTKTSSTSTTTTSTTLGTTTSAAPPAVYPLTGLPVTDPATASRPALVVKIDNADGGSGNSARPQLGLNQADVVYEEMVEGSVTRLAAVFQSTDSDPVGPVRSARSTDVAVFSPLNKPLFAWSGANAGFAQLIRQSPLVDVGYDAHSELYTRRNETGHVAPHNLYSSTPQLYSQTPPYAPPPNPLFQYRAQGDAVLPSATPVGSVNLVFGGGAGNAPVDYTWSADAGGFLRNQKGSPDVDETGAQVAPQNVIVQFVTYHDTGYTDVTGAPVPEADLVGAGTCWILTNGMMIDGNWAKTAPDATPVYTDKQGNPAKLTPGRTWVELVPIGGGTVTG
jgi:hypothetical protein